jgi:pectate lyase
VTHAHRQYRVRFATRGATDVEGNVEFALTIPAPLPLHRIPVVAGSFVHPLKGATELRPLHVEGVDIEGALIEAFTDAGRWAVIGRLLDIQYRDVFPGEAEGTVLSPPSPSIPPPEDGLAGDQVAFPGAEGPGAQALVASRQMVVSDPSTLAVHFVTNTNDSGPGSLRDVLENQVSSSKYDIVIFRTGGTIASTSQIICRAHHVHVPGQTAPGSGLMIRSHPTNGHNGHLIRQLSREHVAYRYLRFRHGHENVSRGGGGLGIIGGGGARHVIYDHLSCSWGGGNAHLQLSNSIDGTPVTEFVSIQNCLLGEGIHNRAVMVTGNERMRHVGYHRNLTAVIGQRHPLIGSGSVPVDPDAGIKVINNLMFAGKNRLTEGNHQSVIDWIKNYQDPGPHLSWRRNQWWSVDANNPGSLYVEGNHIVQFSGDDWDAWRNRDAQSETLPESFRRLTPLPDPAFPVTQMTAIAARDWILQNAGASRRVNAEGEWVPARDGVDQRIAGYVASRSAADTPSDAFGKTVQELNGGWPVMNPGTPPADTNENGLPDAWETRFGISNPAQMTDSGYLAIECYVNGIDPETGATLVEGS